MLGRMRSRRKARFAGADCRLTGRQLSASLEIGSGSAAMTVGADEKGTR